MTEILHIVSDPAHWVAEFIMDGAFAIPAYLFGRWRLKVHDHKAHGIPVTKNYESEN